MNKYIERIKKKVVQGNGFQTKNLYNQLSEASALEFVRKFYKRFVGKKKIYRLIRQPQRKFTRHLLKSLLTIQRKKKAPIQLMDVLIKDLIGEVKFVKAPHNYWVGINYQEIDQEEPCEESEKSEQAGNQKEEQGNNLKNKMEEPSQDDPKKIYPSEEEIFYEDNEYLLDNISDRQYSNYSADLASFGSQSDMSFDQNLVAKERQVISAMESMLSPIGQKEEISSQMPLEYYSLTIDEIVDLILFNEKPRGDEWSEKEMEDNFKNMDIYWLNLEGQTVYVSKQFFKQQRNYFFPIEKGQPGQNVLLIIEYRREMEIDRTIKQKKRENILLNYQNLHDKNYSRLIENFGECVFMQISDQSQLQEKDNYYKKMSSAKQRTHPTLKKQNIRDPLARLIIQLTEEMADVNAIERRVLPPREMVKRVRHFQKKFRDKTEFYRVFSSIYGLLSPPVCYPQ